MKTSMPFIEIETLGDNDAQVTIIDTLGNQDESRFELSISDLEYLGKSIETFLKRKKDEA